MLGVAQSSSTVLVWSSDFSSLLSHQSIVSVYQIVPINLFDQLTSPQFSFTLKFNNTVHVLIFNSIFSTRKREDESQRKSNGEQRPDDIREQYGIRKLMGKKLPFPEAFISPLPLSLLTANYMVSSSDHFTLLCSHQRAASDQMNENVTRVTHFGGSTWTV